MGAVCIERHCGFKSGLNRLEFCFKKSFKIGHDLCAIDHDRPRSSVDRAPDSPELLLDDRGIDSMRKDPGSRFDGTAIVVFFHASPTPSDWNPTLQIPAKREKNQTSL